MRRPVIALALTFAPMMMALPSPASASDSGTCPAPTAYGGTGSLADPFLIATPGNLQALRDTSADWGGHITLAADIDMTGCTWGSSFGPNPVAFSGTFDGAGHVIRGFSLDTTDGSAYVGFIPYLGAGGEVRNLGVEGSVRGSTAGYGDVMSYTGGLVGFTGGNTLVAGSYFAGTVAGSVSAADGSLDPGCFGVCPASASVFVGGLVGYEQADVRDSYARADVTANPTGLGAGSTARANAGGVFGDLAIGTAQRTYAAGAVHATPSASTTYASIGALAGNISAYAAATASTWDATLGPAGNGAGTGGPAGTGLSDTAMRTFASFGPAGLGWPITDGYSAATTWSICPGTNDGYPFLSAFGDVTSCPARPAPDPPPGPGPAPAPTAPVDGATSASAGLAGTASPIAPSAARTTLRVQPKNRPAIPAGRRSVLVDGVQTNGRVTSVDVACELRGIRVLAAAARALCGASVARGSGPSSRERAARQLVVTAQPRCSSGLRVRVRIRARTAGASPATWTRIWRVTASPALPCHVAPNVRVTG